MVDPKDIQFCMVGKEFLISDYQEADVPGDWDKSLGRFEDRIQGVLLRSLRQLDGGKTWEETEYWKFLLESFHNGTPHCGVHNLDELHERCYGFVQRLVDETRALGVLPNWCNEKDYIGINIDRHGHLVFNNGRHRLCVAKYLGIPLIPVCVNVRHTEWAAFRKRVQGYVDKRGAIYAPVLHLDFQDIMCVHSGRAEAVCQAIGPSCKSVLDVGAHWGYHSSYLARRGFECLAVENSSTALSFLLKLKEAYCVPFSVFNRSVFDLERRDFDVVLALRIFHHFLKTEVDYVKLVNFLQGLQVKEMYFQPHNPVVQNMQGAYRNFTPDEFVQFIKDNSCLNHVKELSGNFIGGSIYKLWR
jgi:hypothetical protein